MPAGSGKTAIDGSSPRTPWIGRANEASWEFPSPSSKASTPLIPACAQSAPHPATPSYFQRLVLTSCRPVWSFESDWDHFPIKFLFCFRAIANFRSMLKSKERGEFRKAPHWLFGEAFMPNPSCVTLGCISSSGGARSMLMATVSSAPNIRIG